MKKFSYGQFLKFASMGTMIDHLYYRVLYAQAVSECSFNSNLWENYNNMFGMRPALSRDKYYIGVYKTKGNGNFAIYDSPEDAILCRMDLDTNYRRDGSLITSHAQVIAFMNKVFTDGYTHESNYVSNWLSIYNSLFSAIAIGSDEVLRVGANSDGTVYEGNNNVLGNNGNDDSGNGTEDGNADSGTGGFKFFSFKNIIFGIIGTVVLYIGYRLFKK
jgi:hypothetical protein